MWGQKVLEASVHFISSPRPTAHVEEEEVLGDE